MIRHNRNRTSISRREFILLSGHGIAALSLAALASCAPSSANLPTATVSSSVPTSTAVASTPKSLPSTATPQPTETSAPKTTAPTANADDLDFKIGQMLLLGFRGLTLNDDNPIVADIRERHIGGVVLFDYDAALASYQRNIQSPQQLKALNASLQKLASAPLFISIDQEGGIISRLKEKYGFPPTASEQFLGGQNNVNATRAAAETEGKVLAELGINLNLAPVVDLNVNPNNPIIGKFERSFSADPKSVTAHALAEIEGYHSQKILCTLKHFPGHGSSTSDSHLGFVDVTNTWSQAELEPYQKIIGAGMADAVMTAHIFNAKLDAKYPATLSKPIITGILREQLHYDGVIISDDMQMGAIRQYYGFEQAIELTLNAGVDLIAIANNLVYEPDAAARAIAIIKQLIEAGKISRERIDESYRRIKKLKARLA